MTCFQLLGQVFVMDLRSLLCHFFLQFPQEAVLCCTKYQSRTQAFFESTFKKHLSVFKHVSTKEKLRFRLGAGRVLLQSPPQLKAIFTWVLQIWAVLIVLGTPEIVWKSFWSEMKVSAHDLKIVICTQCFTYRKLNNLASRNDTICTYCWVKLAIYIIAFVST